MMSGVSGSWEKVVENIKFISKNSYITVGVVLTEENVEELPKIIEFAHNLGVSDIRIISAAQWNDEKKLNIEVSDEIKEAHPILAYRLTHLAKGRNVRGLKDYDCHDCPLVLDDMAVMNGKHYPCIIYMREGGAAIGDLTENVREAWYKKTNTHADPICKKNCLDVCIDYNNRWNKLRQTFHDE